MDEVKTPAVEVKSEEASGLGPQASRGGEDAKTSIVDALFDTLTERAAKALVLAGRGLAASARWLEAQAKVVSNLAIKLEKTEPTA